MDDLDIFDLKNEKVLVFKTIAAAWFLRQRLCGISHG
tara:strand:+ start:419 stop:529 length:111 start_codon:yes stop_codon:yes gene_type:complete